MQLKIANTLGFLCHQYLTFHNFSLLFLKACLSGLQRAKTFLYAHDLQDLGYTVNAVLCVFYFKIKCAVTPQEFVIVAILYYTLSHEDVWPFSDGWPLPVFDTLHTGKNKWFINLSKQSVNIYLAGIFKTAFDPTRYDIHFFQKIY